MLIAVMDILRNVLNMPKITMYECDECGKQFDYCIDKLRSGNATFCSDVCKETYLDREFQQEQELQRLYEEHNKVEG